MVFINQEKSESNLENAAVHVKKDLAAQYKPAGDDLSYRELKMATWYVRHKDLLRKIAIGALILWCVITLGYSGFRWGQYAFGGYWDDQNMLARQVAEVVDYQSIQSLYAPRNLRIDSPRVITGTAGKYDFVAEAFNPNDRWVAHVLYRYSYSGGQTAVKQTVVLPQKEQIFAFLGEEGESFPSSVELEIVDIDWQGIDRHAIEDVASYIDERLMFAAEDFKFTRAAIADLPTSKVEFTLVNNSAYSYWQPEFFVVLMRGDQVERVVNLTLEEWRSGDAEPIDLRLLDSGIDVRDIRLVPLIDVFDASEFMEPGE